MSKPAKLTAVLLNLALIAIIESTGQYFHTSGWVHWIYIVFILASVYLIFSRYKLYDPVLSQLLNFSIVALLIFAVSHVFKLVYTNMNAEINLHLAGLTALIIGTELVLKIYTRRSAARLWLWGVLTVLLLLAPVFFISKNITIQFYGPVLLGYAVLIAAIEGVLLMALRQVASAFSLLSNFVRHIKWASVFIVLALVIILLSDILRNYAGVAAYQIEYFFHFSLYAALTFIFTAFMRLSELGGMYARKDESAQNNVRRK